MSKVKNILQHCMVLAVVLMGVHVHAEPEALATDVDPAIAAADQAVKLGIQLYYMKGCANCHAPQAEGVLSKNGPRLTGLTAAYLTRQLQHFRDGVRGADFHDLYGRQMPMAANSLTDVHIGLLANFIASLPPRIAAEQAVMDADVERGKNLYGSRCASCHGADAKGNAALFSPALAGQQNSYLARQIRNYQAGIRGTHAADIYGKQMVAFANLLASEQDILDVSAYLGGIGQPEPAAAPTDNKSVVLSFYQRLDSGDKQAIYDLLALDVRFHFPGFEAKGAHGYWGFVSQVGAYIPDYRHILKDVTISKQNPAIVEVGFINVVGTTAFGEAKEFPGSARYKVVDGRIVEAWISAQR